jgi:large subunit ribosomal protein L13
MKTVTVNPNTIVKKWYIIDAKDVVLGRLASTVARILMGKNKAAFSPHQDVGDHVIVINADQIALTGNKRLDMRYFAHSTYPGGSRTLTVAQASKIRPGYPVRHAIKGMIPHTSVGRKMFKNLFIYGGESHPHSAQKPEVLALK